MRTAGQVSKQLIPKLTELASLFGFLERPLAIIPPKKAGAQMRHSKHQYKRLIMLEGNVLPRRDVRSPVPDWALYPIETTEKHLNPPRVQVTHHYRQVILLD